MWAELISIFIWLCVIAYAVTGGADFGGGMWDLFAVGGRGQDQRRLISRALAPIWEANHVWLIAVIVFVFVAFPRAFASISTALHIPLTIVLIGIVMRGAAFVFRSEFSSAASERRWGYVFSIASIISPLFLGITAGAATSGLVWTDHTLPRTFDAFMDWMAPFPIFVGLFALTLFSFLAAVYLTLETRDIELQEAFRRRALASGGVSMVLAAVGILLARRLCPHIYEGLLQRPWSLVMMLFFALASSEALAALVQRRYPKARIFAIVTVGLVITGWAAAQHPYIIYPQLTVQEAAAPELVLKILALISLIAILLVVPALGYLFWVFKGHTLEILAPENKEPS